MGMGSLPEANIEGDEGAIFAEINITPLTDIFLLLMIIFIVSGSAAVEKANSEKIAEQSSGLKVDLPSGETQEIDAGQTSLMVSIDVNGNIAANGRELTFEELQLLFEQTYIDDKNTQIVLRADSGVAHGSVVQIMESAKKSGLIQLGIATKN